QDLLAFWRLYRLIRRERFEVVHCNSTKAGILGRLAAWLAGAPIIIFTAHGWGINEYQGRLFRAFSILAEKLAGAVSTRVVCVSRYDYDKALALKLVRPDKLSVICNGTPEPGPIGCSNGVEEGRPGGQGGPGGRKSPSGTATDRAGKLAGSMPEGKNGVLPGDMAAARAGNQAGPAPPPNRTDRLRAELGLNDGDLLVGAVMRLAPPKEPLFFLEVARRLVEGENRNPALFFTIVGDGPLRADCEAFIREHGLAGRVFLLGNRENAADLVRDFDVFTLFSRWEGLPLTIIEAMQAGVPVVANAAGGVPELVADGETGFLIDGLDPGAAAGACGRLLGGAALRLAMGEAGRQRAREMFSLEEMLRRYQELYGIEGIIPK
ncbi:MAG: glycosyltransferase family 4 protein, partial [Eubacteriales bacterium]